MLRRRRFVGSYLVAAVAAGAGLAACEGPNALDGWPAQLVARSPIQQGTLAGFSVNDPPAVQLLDPDGGPIADAEITFQSPSGSVMGVATTGSDGIATLAAWTPGSQGFQLAASIPAPFRVPSVARGVHENIGHVAVHRLLHEMGHVLGIGTLWRSDLLNLLAGATGADPFFTGAQGRRAFDRAGGSAYSGSKVPVENMGGAGTRDSHWRESVLRTELMTGFLNAGVLNPLSAVTIASLGDEGYTVNYAAADTYVVPLTPRPGAPGAPGGPGAALIDLGNDILPIPLYEIDARGRLTRVPGR